LQQFWCVCESDGCCFEIVFGVGVFEYLCLVFGVGRDVYGYNGVVFSFVMFLLFVFELVVCFKWDVVGLVCAVV